jgi:hypothetical protein
VSARPRVPLVVVALLLGAIAAGAAASILLTAPSTHPTSPGESPVGPPGATVAWVLVGVGITGLALLIVRRTQGGPSIFPTRVMVTVVVALVVLVGFVALFHLIDGGWQGFEGPVSAGPPANNTTGPGVVVNHTGNVTTTPGNVSFFHLSVPGWVPVTVLLVIAVLVAVFAAPPIAERIQEMREERSRSTKDRLRAEEARAALAAAGRSLEEGSDPRQVIEILYARLLARVAPMVGSVATATPEEIRVGHLRSLGIREAPASALTRLFEEARYSTHPMSAEAAERARDAIRSASEDLDHRVAAR